MNTWIDFKALRSKLNFEEVLRHYKVEVKRKGNQHHGFCPLPNHNGKRKSPSFSANLERGIFQCFGCGAKGNVLEFAALMEESDPKDGTALHKVAAELQKQFCPGLDGGSPEKKPVAKKQDKPTAPEEKLPVVINEPLNFELKDLDPKHPYLLGRGFTQATIDYFGLGFCSRGLHKDRVAIPLHDDEGRLIAYAGRVIDDALISEDNPRYRFPGDRKRDGKCFAFRKSRFLYNGFRLKGPFDHLAVVESFTSIWWLHQNKLPNAVGTMGADCSPEQAELIVSLVKPSGRVWILGEGDDAGERHALSVMRHVAQDRFVRWIRLADGKQPTDFPAIELHGMLDF